MSIGFEGSLRPTRPCRSAREAGTFLEEHDKCKPSSLPNRASGYPVAAPSAKATMTNRKTRSRWRSRRRRGTRHRPQSREPRRHLTQGDRSAGGLCLGRVGQMRRTDERSADCAEAEADPEGEEAGIRPELGLVGKLERAEKLAPAMSTTLAAIRTPGVQRYAIGPAPC